MMAVSRRDFGFEPATSVRVPRATRLLVIATRSRDFREGSMAELPRLLSPGDVVVVNDAATLAASVFGTAKGRGIELRLLGLPDASGESEAVVFGEGDSHTPTEQRSAPPSLDAGDTLELTSGLEATVTRADGRRIGLRWSGNRDEVVAALYRAGRPVQYAHMRSPLALWDVQNVYAAEPWAAEMPSAGRGLDFALLDALRKRGVVVARVTHAAGLSSIGDAAADASLPWVERYRVPRETAELVGKAKRVLAVGTSVVRALESVPGGGEGTTSLRIDGDYRPRVVTSLLTGMHDGATSHADLVSAFVPPDLLAAASRFARERGFLGHEMGDACLIFDD